MTQETLRMSRKERERALAMEQVRAGNMGIVEAALKMRVSRRQAIRIKKRYLSDGEAGLIHRSRGRISNRRLPETTRREALRLYQEEYRDFTATLAAEKMEELNGLRVHRETLRLWLKGAGLWAGRGRDRAHRKRRARRERFGELVQIDGSDHDWFEGRGARACLIVMVDDATGRMVFHMGKSETSLNSLLALRKWVRQWGVPEALYADRKTIFFCPAGSRRETEFQQVARRIGIAMIPAGSPQAKGRVERVNGLLQDRLVKEFRLRKISTIEAANAILDAFAREMSERFGVAPVDPANAHRVVSRHKANLDELFRIEYPRVVARDFTYSFEGRVWQIAKQPNPPAPGKRALVCRSLDGSLSCRYQERKLRVEIAASHAGRARTHSNGRPKTKKGRKGCGNDVL